MRLLLSLLYLSLLSTCLAGRLPSCDASTEILLPDIPHREFYLRFSNPAVCPGRPLPHFYSGQGLSLYTTEGSEWKVTLMTSTQGRLNQACFSMSPSYVVISSPPQLLAEVSMDEREVMLWVNVSLAGADSTADSAGTSLAAPSALVTLSVRLRPRFPRSRSRSCWR